MKVQKLICLDYELVQRLRQEDNASALINALLMTHYKDMRSEEQIIDDVKKLVKIKEDAQARDERIRLAVIKRTKEGIIVKNAKTRNK